jgi:hypothetical protein
MKETKHKSNPSCATAPSAASPLTLRARNGTRDRPNRSCSCRWQRDEVSLPRHLRGRDGHDDGSRSGRALGRRPWRQCRRHTWPVRGREDGVSECRRENRRQRKEEKEVGGKATGRALKVGTRGEGATYDDSLHGGRVEGRLSRDEELGTACKRKIISSSEVAAILGSVKEEKSHISNRNSTPGSTRWTPWTCGSVWEGRERRGRERKQLALELIE